VSIVNGQIYIGSSVNLGVRLLAYVQYLIRNATLLIVKGIVKYGIANFYPWSWRLAPVACGSLAMVAMGGLLWSRDP
jgi:hypothetical protein